MPMGIVSNEEFDAQIGNCVVEAEIITEPKKGRQNGSLEVPESLRKIIGEESEIAGRASALDLAKQFGVSPSSVSAYANGSTSTASYHEPNPALKDYLRSRKQRLTKKALRVAAGAIDELTPERLADVKPRDLAGIAKDMSAIVKNMEPEREVPSGQDGPKFVVYAP